MRKPLWAGRYPGPVTAAVYGGCVGTPDRCHISKFQGEFAVGKVRLELEVEKMNLNWFHRSGELESWPVERAVAVRLSRDEVKGDRGSANHAAIPGTLLRPLMGTRQQIMTLYIVCRLYFALLWRRMFLWPSERGNPKVCFRKGTPCPEMLIERRISGSDIIEEYSFRRSLVMVDRSIISAFNAAGCAIRNMA
jgi:hypothetical protein